MAKVILEVLKEKRLGRELRVLDVPCGMGRLAIPLAKLGINITGLDISAPYVAIARQKARKAGVRKNATFIVGRAEKLDKIFEEKISDNEFFDGAINIHTNLGYGSTRDDRKFLSVTRRVVKKGGLFILTARRNKQNILTHLERASFLETDRTLLLQNNRYNEKNSRLFTTWRFYRKRLQTGRGHKDSEEIWKREGKFHTSVRLYSTQELFHLFESTGWNVLEFGESLLKRSNPLSEQSQGIYIIASAA